jgi:hypothetical protein
MAGRPLILVSAVSLTALFIVVLVLELAPIAVVATTDGLWFMAVPEEFTATLWSPLRPLLWGSYFYHYFGFLYYTAIRPAHWLAEWLLGSREVTIAYTQLYGTIIKVAFSAATIALAAGVLTSRTLPARAKAAILLFMLALLIANADFYWVYHARVTYALSVKLFVTGLLIITLVCAERAVDGRSSGAGVTSAVGAIGGVLFFENLLYFALVIYPTLLIVATTPARLIPARALLGASVGTVSALAVLVAFYAGDGDSIIAAVSAHFAGLASGHPTSQPGYYEHFIALFLDRRSAYFACHVILVAGALVALATLVACLICVLRHRRSNDGSSRTAPGRALRNYRGLRVALAQAPDLRDGVRGHNRKSILHYRNHGRGVRRASAGMVSTPGGSDRQYRCNGGCDRAFP